MEFYPGFEQDNNLKPMKKIKVEPSSLQNDIKWKVEPKPILIIYIPNGMFREYSMKVQIIERLQSSLRDSGWLGIVFETEEKEVKVQSFALKDSQEVQIQELKQIILNEIKGK